MIDSDWRLEEVKTQQKQEVLCYRLEEEKYMIGSIEWALWVRYMKKQGRGTPVSSQAGPDIGGRSGNNVFIEIR